MNSKVGIIIGVIAVLILGASGFMFFQNMDKTAVPGSSSNTSNTIKDALTAAGNTECIYTDEQGRKTRAYIKNGKVRADIASANPAEENSVIFADNTVYIWSAQGAFKMTIPEKMMNQDLSQNQVLSQKEDVMAGIEKYREFCKKSNPNDSLFSPPSDLEFKDFSEIMKGLPTGTSGSDSTQAPNQQQLDQILQQYQNAQ